MHFEQCLLFTGITALMVFTGQMSNCSISREYLDRIKVNSYSK